MKEMLPEQRLAVYLARTNNQRESKPSTAQIPIQWKRLTHTWPQPPGQIYAVYTDYQNDHTGEYTFGLGFTLTALQELPKDMTELILPAAQYFIYPPTNTKAENIIATWQQIWKDFPSPHYHHQHLPLRRSYTTDYERYDSSTQVSICIAVEPSNTSHQ